MCASDEFVGGVSNEERRSIEADPAFVVWARKEQTREMIDQYKREESENRIISVIVLVLLCFGVTCFFAVLALK